MSHQERPAETKRSGVSHATPRRALALIVVVALPVFLATVGAQLVAGIPVRTLLSDTRSIADLPLYAGVVSYLGVLGWAAGASVAFFGATLVPRACTKERAFLLRAGFFTAWLCLDDLLEIHERALAGLGMPEVLTYAVYAVLVLGHLAVSVPIIRTTQWWLLTFAVASLGLSVLVDLLIRDTTATSLLRLADEGPKLVGILAWSGYHADAAHVLIRRSATGVLPADRGSK